MDQGPLVREEIEAGEELAREFDHYAPLKVAFWLKASDADQRYLYLASDQIDDDNFDLGYGEVLRLTNKRDSPYLDPFRVKVIAGSEPLALAATEVNDRFPSRAGIRFGGRSFGGLVIDDAYIYPARLPAATT